MNIRDIMTLFVRKWWIIFLATFLATIMAVFVNLYLVKSEYEANSTLYVMAKKTVGEDRLLYDDVTVSIQLAKDYKEILKSTSIAEETLRKLGITDITPEDLLDNINVSSKTDTGILIVSVRDKNPERARDLANAYVKEFINSIYPKTQVNIIGTVETANTPTKPVGSSMMKYTLFTFFAALISSTTIATLFPLITGKVNSVEEVERVTGLNVLGLIPESNIK